MPTMLSPTSHNKTKRSLHRMARRGSLPLKKRRLLFEPPATTPMITSSPSAFSPIAAIPPPRILPLLQQPNRLSFLASAVSMVADPLPQDHTPQQSSPPLSLSFIPSSEGPAPMSPRSAVSSKHSLRGTGANKPKHLKNPPAYIAPDSPRPKSQLPDKRYTGTGLRCCATTTRGRACAYKAVGPTPYCNLHAEYATNPAPARKWNSSTNSTGSATSHHHSDVPSTTCTRVPLAPSRRRTSAKLAEKHAAATAPLLSMISTDQWYHKAVRIALGPLRGRTGRVEKWGNGWVSVRLDHGGKGSDSGGGGVWHNRRSFELVLLDSPNNSSNTPKSKTATKHRPPITMTSDRPQTPKASTTRQRVIIPKVTPLEGTTKNVMLRVVEQGVDLRLPKDTNAKVLALQPREGMAAVVRKDDEDDDDGEATF